MTPPPNDDARQDVSRHMGTVENGHVLTRAGWVPLRRLPTTARPPYYPGDVKNGHVFTGEAWAPFTESAPTPPAPAGASGKRGRGLRTGGAIAIGAVTLIAIIVVIGTLANRPVGREAQADFVAAVQAAQSSEADNGAQVNQAKVSLGDKLCEILPTSLKVEEWKGTVVTISDTLGGDDAILKIELAKGIAIEADAGLFDTGIEAGSDVYGQVAGLSEGQSVTFSGAFQKDGTYCISENSIVDSNGLRTPTFAFKFSSVQ
ncbi:hypothetical protein KVF89_16350 [Nocardioides carbamazepini]|uniref:hypothetical protein n=1 Tax=Nocardioides carbamazepini TaxID=2854259 RepID=UPI00214A8186|nr:hypothetical protein [Nocardioides carbamazepini]MCR1784112.1 hypothetical protein [Nocardioides carbamazepini]